MPSRDEDDQRSRNILDRERDPQHGRKEMMNYREKQEMIQALHKYVQAKPDITVGQFQRVSSWLGGMTFREIGAEEGVSAQAISQSVKRDLKKVKAFASSNDKQ